MSRSSYSLSLILILLSVLRCSADTLDKIKAIQSAQVVELPQLWKQHGEKSDFRYLVMTRWIEIAPDEFFKNELTWREFERGWHVQGRIVGQSLDGPLSGHPIVQKMLDERVIPHFFAGLAEVRPEEVMEFVRTRGKLLTWNDQHTIATGIIIGLAQTKPDKAVTLVDRKASYDWKNQYQNLVTGHQNFRFNSSRSEGESLALWRWVVFHPQEAISLITEEEEMALHPQLAATLALQLPDQVEHLFHKLPTGSKKRAIKESIDIAKEKPTEILNYLRMAPPAEIRKQHNFQSLLKTATTIHPITFPAWLTDHRLAHLPPEEIRLLRSIIKERWAKNDPESLLRFQGSHYHKDLSVGLEAWWKKAPQAVTDYVKEENCSNTWDKLIHVVALSDGESALKLYQALPEKVRDRISDDDLLFAIAKGDREAFLNYALEDDEEKQKRLTVLARAWLREDFDWTVATLARHEVNPFQVVDEFPRSAWPRSDWQTVPFDLLHKMPPAWKKVILDSGDFLRHDAFRWLSIKTHPALSAKELREVQNGLRFDAYWIGWKDIPRTQKLIKEGDWLSDEVKSCLARWAVIRSHEHEVLRPWVESLPPAVNAEALEALEYFRNAEIQRTQTSPALSDLKKLSDYLENSGREQRFSMHTWTISEIKNFHDEIKKIKPEEAGHLFKSVFIDCFPLRIQISLIPKILGNPDLVKSKSLRLLVGSTAGNYASRQPARAAEWAMALSDEPLQTLAAGMVADSWKRQNANEAKAWVLTLPKPLQQRFGYGEYE